MSFQSLSDCFSYVQDAPLSSNEVLVLLTIANYADRTGANAYPSLPTLSRMTKLGRRPIQYALRTLEQKQVIATTCQRGRTGRQTYTLLVPTCVESKGAASAPLALVKGVVRDKKGAPDDIKGASGAPNPVLEPEKNQKISDDACAQGERNPPASPCNYPVFDTERGYNFSGRDIPPLGGCHEGDDLLATWKTDGSYPTRWTVAEASLIAQAIPRFCLGTHTIETEMLRLSKVEGRGEDKGEPDATRAAQPPQRMEAVA